MFQQMMRLLTGSWDAANTHAENLHGMLIGTVIFVIAMILVMWGFNITSMKEVNLIFFLIGGLGLVAKFSQPRMIVASAAIGAVAGGLQDKDISKNAAEGVKWLYKVGLGMLLGFWVLAGLLATWSFERAPAAFFPIAAMAMLLAVAVEFFEMKGGMFKKVLIAYAVGVILISLAKTIPSPFTEKEVGAAVPQRDATIPPAEISPVMLTVSGGCSERIKVSKGWDINSTLLGNVRQEKMDTATSEWTPMVNGASLYATRYCGNGQVSYQFVLTKK
jgi:hypothetical protein